MKKEILGNAEAVKLYTFKRKYCKSSSELFNVFKKFLQSWRVSGISFVLEHSKTLHVTHRRLG